MTKHIRITHHKTYKIGTVSRAVERGQMRFVAHYPRRKRNLVLRLGDGPQTIDELSIATDLKPATIRRYIVDIELQTGLEVQRKYGNPEGTHYWIGR
jgi:Predicted transcriptional regulator